MAGPGLMVSVDCATTDRLGPNNNTRQVRTGDSFFTLASLLIGDSTLNQKSLELPLRGMVSNAATE